MFFGYLLLLCICICFCYLATAVGLIICSCFCFLAVYALSCFFHSAAASSAILQLLLFSCICFSCSAVSASAVLLLILPGCCSYCYRCDTAVLCALDAATATTIMLTITSLCLWFCIGRLSSSSYGAVMLGNNNLCRAGEPTRTASSIDNKLTWSNIWHFEYITKNNNVCFLLDLSSEENDLLICILFGLAMSFHRFR